MKFCLRNLLFIIGTLLLSFSCSENNQEVASTSSISSVVSPPSTPSSLKAEAANEEIQVSWDVDDDLQYVHVYYSLSYFSDTDDAIEVVVAGDEVDLKFEGLTNGVRYYFGITYESSSGGEGNLSSVISAVPYETDSPVILETTPGLGESIDGLESVVIVSFDEEIDVDTFTSTSVVCSGEHDLEYDLTFDDETFELSIDFGGQLILANNYVCEITTSIEDLFGNDLIETYDFHFFTEDGQWNDPIEFNETEIEIEDNSIDIDVVGEDNAFAVALMEDPDSLGDYYIYAYYKTASGWITDQRSNLTSTTDDAGETTYHTGTSISYYQDARIIGNSNYNAMSAWKKDTTGEDIQVRLFNNDGTGWTDIVDVNDTASASAIESFAIDFNDEFTGVVAWIIDDTIMINFKESSEDNFDGDAEVSISSSDIGGVVSKIGVKLIDDERALVLWIQEKTTRHDYLNLWYCVYDKDSGCSDPKRIDEGKYEKDINNFEYEVVQSSDDDILILYSKTEETEGVIIQSIFSSIFDSEEESFSGPGEVDSILDKACSNPLLDINSSDQVLFSFKCEKSAGNQMLLIGSYDFNKGGGTPILLSKIDDENISSYVKHDISIDESGNGLIAFNGRYVDLGDTDDTMYFYRYISGQGVDNEGEVLFVDALDDEVQNFVLDSDGQGRATILYVEYRGAATDQFLSSISFEESSDD